MKRIFADNWFQMFAAVAGLSVLLMAFQRAAPKPPRIDPAPVRVVPAAPAAAPPPVPAPTAVDAPAGHAGMGSGGGDAEPAFAPLSSIRAGTNGRPTGMTMAEHIQWVAQRGNEQRAQLLAAVDEVKKDRTLRFVEIPELVLEPQRYAGRKIAVMGIATGLQLAVGHPHFTLGDSFGGAAGRVPVSLAGFSLEKKRDLMSWETMRSDVVLVMGTFQSTPQNEYFVEADSCRKIVTVTAGVPISKLLETPYVPDLGVNLDQKTFDAIQAAAAALRRDRRYRFVEIQDLILTPERYADQDLSTVAVPGFFASNGTDSHVSLAMTWASSSSSLQLRTTSLPFDGRKALLRDIFPPQAAAVRAVMRRSDNGAYFLDAREVGLIGPLRGTSIPDAVKAPNH